VNLEDFRGLFPALERVTYLNTATSSPAARPVLDALERVQGEWAQGEFSWQEWEEQGEATRELFASLVDGRPEHVALVNSVSTAAATVAASLPRGRVVVGAREFQSNLFPWLALRRRGFDVIEIPATDGVVRTDALVEAIDDETILAAVSEVQSSDGFRVRIDDIAEACRSVGARLFVDAIQSLGALRFIPGADYVAAQAYKWLIGPRGAGWLWASPDRLGELQPLAPSWKSVADPYTEYYGSPWELPDHARRVDTSMAWFSWPGARVGLETLRELDPHEVESRCLSLAREFREEAARRGFSMVPEDAPSHIVALDAPDPGALRDRLLERKVIGAVRGGSLRLGFHAYNDERDVATALDAIGRAST
jgi:selenocysteine lyase/cysteine desulfurase